MAKLQHIRRSVTKVKKVARTVVIDAGGFPRLHEVVTVKKIVVRETGGNVAEKTDPSDRGRHNRFRMDKVGKGVQPPPGKEGCPNCGSKGGDLRVAYNPSEVGWERWCYRCGYMEGAQPIQYPQMDPPKVRPIYVRKVGPGQYIDVR